jgi:hypothetical protein
MLYNLIFLFTFAEIILKSIEMKKILFTAVLSIIFFNVTFAQSRFGITTGLEFSTYSINYTDDKLDSKMGIKLGLLIEYALADNIFIVPEIVFTQRGIKEKGGSDVIDQTDGIPYYDFSETLNYAQIPVNLMFKFKTGNDSKFSLFTGPYAGIAFSGKERSKKNIEYRVIETVNDIKFGGKNIYNKFDFGLNLGVGFEYADWFIKLQYNLGLSNMMNKKFYVSEDLKYIDGDSSKNRNIGISIGYLFY